VRTSTLVGTPPATKRERQRAAREIVARESIANQQELADRLAARGFVVTQATVSRDIAELGLAKARRGDRHVYVLADDLPRLPAGVDDRLPDLSDIPVSVGRSGSSSSSPGPGTASVIAQAIDESTSPSRWDGRRDNAIVLFADEAAQRWLYRFSTVVAGRVERRPGREPDEEGRAAYLRLDTSVAVAWLKEQTTSRS
jgi:arginine repressor